MHRQKSDSIDWARFSWNPVTGCKHGCEYCYARDIAERFFAQGFEPAFQPERLGQPSKTRVPNEAAEDVAYRNIFTCSMADLFGRWVPAEWIDAVLTVAKEYPQWNFLCLTKFPQRTVKFEPLPQNVWMGTSVDSQVRVANAEKAFATISGGIRWLSCKPMLTPLKFDHDFFNWRVVGGASRSKKTPAFHPPTDWIDELESRCDGEGISVFEKSNL
jgi:protein gp37